MIAFITSRASARERSWPSSSRASAAWIIALASRKFLRERAARRGVSTDSGWNCTPSTGSSRWRTAITSPSADVADTSRHVRHRRRGERVVAAGREAVRQAGEDAAAVVARRRVAFPWTSVRAGADLAAEHVDDRLVAEADAEHRHAARRRPAPSPPRRRRSRAGPGPGEMTRCDGASALGLLDRDLVVPPHDHLRSELAEQVRQVVRERVVVVDQQQHAISRASASSIARSTAASLFRHSWCSAAGSESATIPPPACR